MAVFGDNTSYLTLWEAAAELGVDVHLVGAPGGLSFIAPRDNLTLHPLTPTRLRGGRQTWCAYPGLRQLIDVQQPDVVHVKNEPWSLAALQALAAGRPTVVHGAETIYGQGRAPAALIRQSILARSLPRFAGFVGWSRRAVEAAQAAGLPMETPTLIAPAELPDPATFAGAVDRRSATRARLGYHDDEVVLGFVGRYSAEKGLPWLFEAFRPLGADGVRLACFGSGPEESFVRGAAQRSAGTVRDHGRLDLSQVPDVMTALDVLVLPSLTLPWVEEQFGKVVIEAMLAGTPVVASRVGALPEVVAGCGELVDEGDVEALTKTLDRLITDKHARLAAGARGFERAIREYSPVRTAQRVIALWEKSSGTASPCLGRTTGRTTPRIAVLMTSHNRQATTLACLESLFDQQLDGVNLEVFLVDDGSTDGTPVSVTDRYPQVHLIEGSGDLFWSGAMAIAQRAATTDHPDFLLWLNDDVRLARGALATLLGTHDELVERGRPPSLVVGAMADPTTGTTTYSGVVRNDRVRRMRFAPVEPRDVPQRCEAMHGNLVLVPRAVYRRVGGFDPAYHHAINDFDYGLRSTEQGCEVWLAPGHLGTCPQDHLDQPWADTTLSVFERARLLASPKGLPPRDWLRFVRRHGGPAWPLLFVGPYARFLAAALREALAGHSLSRAQEVM